MKTYSAYHCHSVYSLLDGIAQLKDYFQRADGLGLKSISISDHGNMHNVIDAYEVSKDYDVKYSAGIELYVARKTRFDKDEEERSGKASDELTQRGPYHLSVIAQNQMGFSNLIKLSSRSYTEGWYGKARGDHELLEQHGKGLIILSGCLSSEISQALMRDDYAAAETTAHKMQDFVGKDNFYIEVMFHGIPEEERNLKKLVDLAKKLNVKIIPTLDSHYVTKDQYHHHDNSLCIGTASFKADEKRFRFYNDQFYLKSYEEMASIFPPEWLKNTLELNEKIEELDFELKGFKFPIYDLAADHYLFLKDLTYKGAKQKYLEITQEMEDRLEYELDVINRMGFTDYMLIVWDIINWCHKNDIIAAARGSVSGSLVARALNITLVDPIALKLPFERFLVDGRITMPDVDIDVAEDRREEVISYIREKYGSDRVCQVCNFSTIKSKAAVKDTARILGYEYQLGERISNLIPPPFQGFSKSIDEALKESEQLQAEYTSKEEVKEVIDAARGIEGLIRQTGVHASAILVTPGPLIDYIPIMQKPNKDGTPGPIITQWNGTQIESQGLLKIDILGLNNYTIIDKTLKSIKQRLNTEVDINNIPLDDSKAYELLCGGDTSTLFQIGASGGISNLLYEMQPTKLEDIMAVLSLYRPGPLGTNMDKKYIARRRGEPFSYIHPSLKPVLKDTYALMIYQEQVLNLLYALGNYSVLEADSLRRVIGKKKKEEMPKYRSEFIKRCTEYSGISETIANKTFDEMEYFASYAFSSCHASSYSFIALQTAYLKAHFPADYMAAVLSSTDTVEKVGEYVEDARKLGLNIIGPSINTSARDFLVLDDNTIQYGLKSIHGLGIAALDRILNAQRNYDNIYDLLRRLHPELLNKSLIEHLLFAGAFDELVPEQDSHLSTRADRIQILNAEARELGTYITEHPLKGIWSYLENDITHTIVEIPRLMERTVVTISGVIIDKDVRYSKRDRALFIFFKIQDTTGMIDIAAFGKTAKEYQDLVPGDIILVKGAVLHERKLIGEEESKKSRINIYECRKPELPEYAVGESIILNFKNKPSPYISNKIIDIIEKNPGDSPVLIKYQSGDLKLTYKYIKPTNLKVKEQLEMAALYENQNS